MPLAFDECPVPNNFSWLVFPDSTLADSIVYVEGDTVEIYTSGPDSIVVIFESAAPDSLLEEAWTIAPGDPRMLIHVTHHDFTINQGVNGVNLTDFFETNHGNENHNANYAFTDNPWEALIALAPKTIRIFSGAGGKFMHPLGSPVDPAEPEGMWNGGYGFSWEELVPFYDHTGGAEIAPSLSDIISDFALENPMKCEHCKDWMDEKFVGDFEDFYNKAAAQPTFDPGDYGTGMELDRPLYINQCIDLIGQIESANPGHVVDVIYVVNIQTQTADDVLAVIDYLRDHDVHVTGIEMGNEVYFDFHALSMGLDDFPDYWNYINGVNFGDLEDILPADVYADHDYIGKLKGNAAYYDLKIGLPAQNTPNCGAEYDFPVTPPGIATHELTPVITDPGGDPCPCFYPDWNVKMTEYYDETVGTGAATRYAFDAIIFHTYYGPPNNTGTCSENSNWRDILLTNLHTGFDPDDLEKDLDFELFPDPWNYVEDIAPFAPSAPDGNLIDAFYGITGIHHPLTDSPLLPGNYKDFTRTRLDISYEEHAAQMHFTAADTDPKNKQVWVTEYNLDDKIDMPKVVIMGVEYPAIQAENQEIVTPIVAAATNTFAHTIMMQHWFLWHLKASFDPDYRNNFLTVATTQNFLSAGSTIGLMTRSDKADQERLHEIATCSDPEIPVFYVRKAQYFGSLLQKPIIANDLKYLKSNISLGTLNNNTPPTLFIKKDGFESTDDTVYVVYDNVTDAYQTYIIEPGTLVNDYGGAAGYEITLGSGTIEGEMLDADQLYSSAGSVAHFKFNEGYSNCAVSIDNENRFEIDALESLSPQITCPGSVLAEFPGAVCISVPPISMGYVKIPFDVAPLRRGEMIDNYVMYPNPANEYFSVYRKNTADTHDKILYIDVYSIFGHQLLHEESSEGERVQIGQLPSGTYIVMLYLENGNMEFEQLVKMK